VALVNGLVMGGGAAMVAPLKFAVVTEKTIFATPEASVGLHTDCSFSYIHSRLPGYLGSRYCKRKSNIWPGSILL
jgi:3-hydroxyisobutyryl-CoA hydrolase